MAQMHDNKSQLAHHATEYFCETEFAVDPVLHLEIYTSSKGSFQMIPYRAACNKADL